MWIQLAQDTVQQESSPSGLWLGHRVGGPLH